jgi:hypothetical protein
MYRLFSSNFAACRDPIQSQKEEVPQMLSFLNLRLLDNHAITHLLPLALQQMPLHVRFPFVGNSTPFVLFLTIDQPSRCGRSLLQSCNALRIIGIVIFPLKARHSGAQRL